MLISPADFRRQPAAAVDPEPAADQGSAAGPGPQLNPTARYPRRGARGDVLGALLRRPPTRQTADRDRLSSTVIRDFSIISY